MAPIYSTAELAGISFYHIKISNTFNQEVNCMFKHLLIVTAFLFSNLTFAQTNSSDDSLYSILSKKEENYFNDSSYDTAYASVALQQQKGMNFLDASSLNKILEIDKERSVFIPLELTNEELITLAAATSLGIVAFANDQQISDTVQRNNSVVANKITSVGNFIGETSFAYIAAGSYFLGVVMKDNKMKQVGLFIIGAEIAQSIVTTSVKNLVQRSRPSDNNGPYELENGKKSFWSGHTATSFTLATVISEMYKEEYPIVPYVAYGLAALTAYARVRGNNHWASDVLAGAVAGHLVAKLAMSYFNNDNNRSGITISPELDPNGDGFRIYLSWTPKTKKYIFY